jgi:hypothetical protein
MTETCNFDKYASFIKRCIDITTLSHSEAGVLNTGRRGKQGKMNSQGTSQTILDKMARWRISRERKIIGSIDLEGLLRRSATYNFDVVSTSDLMRKLETEKSSVKGAESLIAKKTLELVALTGDLAISKQAEISRIKENVALFTATIAQLDSEIKEKSMNRKQCQETAVTCFRILACEGDYSAKDADALFAAIKSKTSRVAQIHGFVASPIPVKSSVESTRSEEQSKHVDLGHWRRSGIESSQFQDNGFHNKSKFGDSIDNRESHNTSLPPKDVKLSLLTNSSEFGSSRTGGGNTSLPPKDDKLLLLTNSLELGNTDGWTNVGSSKRNNSRADSRTEIKFSSSGGNRFKDLDKSYVPHHMRESVSCSSEFVKLVPQSVEQPDEFPELVTNTSTTKSMPITGAWSKGVSDAVKATIAIVTEDEDEDKDKDDDAKDNDIEFSQQKYVKKLSRPVKPNIKCDLMTSVKPNIKCDLMTSVKPNIKCDLMTSVNHPIQLEQLNQSAYVTVDIFENEKKNLSDVEPDEW